MYAFSYSHFPKAFNPFKDPVFVAVVRKCSLYLIKRTISFPKGIRCYLSGIETRSEPCFTEEILKTLDKIGVTAIS